MKIIKIVAVASLALMAGCCSFRNAPKEAFNIASFNIRLIADKGEHAWEKRLPRIVKVIEKYGFDVMGVQEAMPRQVEELSAALPGWLSVGLGREPNNMGEASSIFYKADRFECLSHETFWLSETPSVAGSKSWKSVHPRVCTRATLRDKRTGKVFHYFNTHLDYNTVYTREMSMKLILERMHRLPKDNAVFLSGDMNDRPGSVPMKMAEVYLRDTFDASETCHEGTPETFTMYKGPQWRIDFIFASPGVRVLNHRTVNDRFDGFYPSDHDPVVATVVLQ